MGGVQKVEDFIHKVLCPSLGSAKILDSILVPNFLWVWQKWNGWACFLWEWIHKTIWLHYFLGGLWELNLLDKSFQTGALDSPCSRIDFKGYFKIMPVHNTPFINASLFCLLDSSTDWVIDSLHTVKDLPVQTQRNRFQSLSAGPCLLHC